MYSKYIGKDIEIIDYFKNKIELEIQEKYIFNPFLNEIFT